MLLFARKGRIIRGFDTIHGRQRSTSHDSTHFITRRQLKSRDTPQSTVRSISRALSSFKASKLDTAPSWLQSSKNHESHLEGPIRPSIYMRGNFDLACPQDPIAFSLFSVSKGHTHFGFSASQHQKLSLHIADVFGFFFSFFLLHFSGL